MNTKVDNVPGIAVGRQVAGVGETKCLKRPVAIIELHHLVGGVLRVVGYDTVHRRKGDVRPIHEKDVVVAKRRGLRLSAMRNNAPHKQNRNGASCKSGNETVNSTTEMIAGAACA